MINIDNIKLLKAYREGNSEAINQFMEQNKRLVYKIVNHYAINKNKDELEDLFQEGCIGLYIAAERFDFSKGTKFSTYAVYWIQQKILRYIKCKMTQWNHEISLNKAIKESKDGDGLTLEEMLEDETINLDENIEKEELKKKINELIKSTLNLQEEQIIRCKYGFYGECYTHKDIGELLEKDAESIIKINNKALNKLRRNPAIFKEYRRRLEERLDRETYNSFHNTELAALGIIHNEKLLNSCMS